MRIYTLTYVPLHPSPSFRGSFGDPSDKNNHYHIEPLNKLDASVRRWCYPTMAYCYIEFSMFHTDSHETPGQVSQHYMYTDIPYRQNMWSSLSVLHVLELYTDNPHRQNMWSSFSTLHVLELYTDIPHRQKCMFYGVPFGTWKI